MRIVFMGTPSISEVCLRRFSQEPHEIVGVYTKPDTPKNRGMNMAMSQVKTFAMEQNYPVFQPTTFKDDAVYEELKALNPDLILVVAYGKILPQRILDIPKHGCINIHGSILPELRGSAPIQWSILNGCDETGLTAMYMAAGMDSGDMIEVRSTPIEPLETSGELMARLAVIGGELLADTVKKVVDGTITAQVQDESKVTLAPMLSREMAPIDWNKSPREIVDHVRGLVPWPIATTQLLGKPYKIHQVLYTDETTTKACGELVALTKQGLQIACANGNVLLITKLQAEGKKAMAAADYFRGHPIVI